MLARLQRRGRVAAATRVGSLFEPEADAWGGVRHRANERGAVAHVRMRVEAVDMPAPRDGQRGRARHEHLAGGMAGDGRRPDGYLGEPREVIAERRAGADFRRRTGTRIRRASSARAPRAGTRCALACPTRTRMAWGGRPDGARARRTTPRFRREPRVIRRYIQQAHHVVGVAEEPDVWLSALEYGRAGRGTSPGGERGGAQARATSDTSELSSRQVDIHLFRLVGTTLPII